MGRKKNLPLVSLLVLPLFHSFSRESATAAIGPTVPIIANEFEDVALIGGGSSITPLYQHLNHALNDPANRTRYTLLYANVAEADILLRDELATLQCAHPHTFKVMHTLDNPPSRWSGMKGYISREFIKAHVPSAEKGNKIKVLICGMS